MKDHYYQLKKLLEKSELTDAEMQWLLSYLENSADPELKEIMKRQFVNHLENSAGVAKSTSDKILKAIHEEIGPPPTVKRTRRIPIRRLAIAASVAALIIFSAVLLNNSNSEPDVNAEGAGLKFKNDVDPGGNKATLTLGDGSVILLDDAKNGTLAQQGGAKVIKLDGKLLYDLDRHNTKQVVYNTVSTPKGGQYQLELPDGSLLWLNASSSVRFPTAFVGKERRVEITGEAYFEVAKDYHKPFVVSVNNAEVQVLGTHFNINAYADEETLNTTLLEGSVRFMNNTANTVLRPGQQSQLAKNGDIKVANSVNVDEVIAWKNGFFNFESAAIETIMRQLSRWYDVDVDYKGKTDDLFIAEMRRDIKLSDALKALELTGKVKFGIDGKKIIVMP